MPDFHQIIEAQFATTDASDAKQREAVYERTRVALKQTIAGDPEHADSLDYASGLERTIAEIERRYAEAGAAPSPPAGQAPPPRARRLGAMAAAAVAAVGLVAAGLWFFGAPPFGPRGGDSATRVENGGRTREAPATPEQAWNAAFRDGDVRLLNQAIDSGFRLDTSHFADAYVILMMQPSKGLANPEFRAALRRLKDDIRPSICGGITLSNIVAVRDMIQQIGADEYRFYCGTSKPAFSALRGELSAQWQSSCKSLLPVEELARKKTLDRDCAYDGFNGEDKIKWESGSAAPTFSRLARIRDAIVELERLL